VVGCGDSGGPPQAPRHTVTGTVKLDGQALNGGTITFESDEDVAAGNAPATAEIKEGAYEVEATVGLKRVVISRKEEYGEADETGVKPTRETIPARYNTSTELSADIKADAENVHNFELNSK
jgi:hypothetical protein